MHAGYKFSKHSNTLEDVHMPVKDLLPMVDPTSLLISGWDISHANLYEACIRARVLEPDLIKQLKGELENIRPLPAAFRGDFIASNQADRADNVLNGSNREIIIKLREDIRLMKARCDKVVVLWTANTEQYLLPEIDSVD